MPRRRLDAELVHRHMFPSRVAAQSAIAAGEVEVDGLVVVKPSSQVDNGASIRLLGEPARYVSRGGLKLEAALDAFPVEIMGKTAIDVGASTGGFTDCLLQRAATAVTAVDVGYGQLAWELRNDPRVTVLERLNARHMEASTVGGPFEIVVADLSFISLTTVAEALADVGAAGADWILLVKPQFEAGRDQVGKGGVVRDVAVRAAALRRVIAAFAAIGLGACGVVDSPIAGAKGNREFLLWLRRGPNRLADADLEALEGLRHA